MENCIRKKGFSEVKVGDTLFLYSPLAQQADIIEDVVVTVIPPTENEEYHQIKLSKGLIITEKPEDLKNLVCFTMGGRYLIATDKESLLTGISQVLMGCKRTIVKHS